MHANLKIKTLLLNLSVQAVVFKHRPISGSCNSRLILTQTVLWWSLPFDWSHSKHLQACCTATARRSARLPIPLLPWQVFCFVFLFFFNAHFPFLANSQHYQATCCGHVDESLCRSYLPEPAHQACPGRFYLFCFDSNLAQWRK